MWDDIKEGIINIITEPDARAVVCLLAGFGAYKWLDSQTRVQMSTAETLALIGLICGAVALLSILWYMHELGAGFFSLVGVVLCIVVLVNCGKVYGEVKSFEQPVVQSSYGGYMSFTGRTSCRFCVKGKCRSCKSGVYDHGRYFSDCIVCDGDGVCNKCGGDGWIY